MSSDAREHTPIFVLGVSQRSGTNYLSQLIRQHPSCGAPATIWEDYLLCPSDLLVAYAKAVSRRWRWESGTPDEKFESEMLTSIGDGLLQFLSSDTPSARLVTKTPDVTNLDNFFRLFPRAYLIVLVRDGRSVTESRVKTFRDSYDLAMQKWLVGAKTIVSFQEKLQPGEPRHLLVRYEDLWVDVVSELRKIFEFCGLDPESYDYTAAKEQPILGSSEYMGEGHLKVHWTPVAKPLDFSPTKRWKSWSRSRHELFNYVAGDYMERFGYQLKIFNNQKVLWYPLVRMLSVKSKVNYVFQYAVQEIKRSLVGLLTKERTMQIRRAFTTGVSGRAKNS